MPMRGRPLAVNFSVSRIEQVLSRPWYHSLKPDNIT